jgi:hypothetical protein
LSVRKKPIVRFRRLKRPCRCPTLLRELLTQCGGSWSPDWLISLFRRAFAFEKPFGGLAPF